MALFAAAGEAFGVEFRVFVEGFLGAAFALGVGLAEVEKRVGVDLLNAADAVERESGYSGRGP